MDDWHLYIIECNDGSLYTGVTLDVDRRLKEHQEQGDKCAKYLKGKAPLTLVFQECVGAKEKAFSIERLVKNSTKKNKENLVKGNISLDDFIKIKAKYANMG